MSEAALQIYEDGLKQQHNRNEARRIRSRVTEARRNPHPASVRWPFELLQNALDAGPRDGRSTITVCLRQQGSRVIFEHDGAPFTSIELAALLSGGSSKEFESDVTTGRFGTGFLVTHVLAERTRLKALLEVHKDYEQFDLVLDRGGDEDAILGNIQSCSASIRAATPVPTLDGLPSASFEYLLTDDDTLTLGIEALKQALPYLYVTRPSLGRVELEIGDNTTEVWTAGEMHLEPFEDGQVEQRCVRVERNGVASADLRIYRFTIEAGTAGALVLVEQAQDNWNIRLPHPQAPRVYREYPLRGSGFLPIAFILDAKFEPDQERSRLLMGDEDKRLVQEALAAAALGVRYAFSRKWTNSHLLANASDPGTAFDPSDASERQWWVKQLAAFAGRLATLPIVECSGGFLPSIDPEGTRADFIIPRLLPDAGDDETSIDRMWSLMNAATDLYPPLRELALDWSGIATGWDGLGLQLDRCSVKGLADYVRADAQRLDELHLVGDKTEWVARFLDVVGECWSKRAGVDLLAVTGMLPDQNQRLCSAGALQRDGGISDGLKDICAGMGRDVRGQLFLTGFDETAKALGLKYLEAAIAHAIPATLSEVQVIEAAVKHVQVALPEDKDCDGATQSIQEASVRLACYLWDCQGKQAAAVARQLPLITMKNRAVRWSPDRLMMAPVCTWPESAREFANAYPPNRVLADVYGGDPDQDISSTVPALVDWGIAIPEPITTDVPAELKGPRLAAISSADTQGVIVSGETFSQIALLQPEVLNRCQEGTEEARALLGLVLCHVARHDTHWENERSAKGRRAGEDVDVRLHSALWLADLTFRAWVPMLGDEGKSIKMVANASTLKDLLDPAWLEKNDAAIKLLSDWFGFDQLELRLLGLAPDPQLRLDLRNGLAKLVESAGADPSVYASLAQDVEARQRRSRDVARCRRFGLAVQDAVRAAIEHYGLKLTLVDRGFDYQVDLPADVLEDASTKFEVGPYLLEVKATTSGGARLTPLQAATASQECSRYVLCVVDLRNSTEEQLEAQWTATTVEPLARIVSDIGDKTEETYVLVEEAKSNSVGIRNDLALRYEVPPSVWELGASISEWVASLSGALTKSAL